MVCGRTVAVRGTDGQQTDFPGGTPYGAPLKRIVSVLDSPRVKTFFSFTITSIGVCAPVKYTEIDERRKADTVIVCSDSSWSVCQENLASSRGSHVWKFRRRSRLDS